MTDSTSSALVPTVVVLAGWMARHTERHPGLPVPIMVEVRAATYVDPQVTVRIDGSDRRAVAADLVAWADSLDRVDRVDAWIGSYRELHLEVHGSVLTEAGVVAFVAWGVTSAVDTDVESVTLATLQAWATGGAGVAA
jgi:hypothetical protein